MSRILKSSRVVWLSGFFLLVACEAFSSSLSHDEADILQRVRAIAAAPVEDFTLLGDSDGRHDLGYRYQLAFLAYGLCSLVRSEPSLHEEAHRIFSRLVDKMEQPATLAYWKADGFDGDGLIRDNIMYRGHLNLMYALAHDRFGETRFDERFHALSRALFDELNRDRPICCEPDHLFFQCNSVSALSLWLHDRAFGTSYGTTARRILTWARKQMPLPDTTLVCDDFRPSTGKSNTHRAGYANAWAIAFLWPVPGMHADMQKMYADWRRTFAEPSPLTIGNSAAAGHPLRLDEILCSTIPPLTFGYLRIVKGAPSGESLSPFEALSSSLLATTFGLLAARAAGDEAMHEQLEHTVAYIDALVANFEHALPPERRVQARLYSNIALFARSFRGWDDVLHIRRAESVQLQTITGPGRGVHTASPN